jgi:hypothetical protein
MEQAARLLYVSVKGIRELRAADEAAKILVRYEKITSDEADGYTELATLAKQEVEDDFPLLRAHTLMGIWGALEVLVEDVIVAWLLHEPAPLTGEEVGKIRIPLAEFQAFEEEQRIRLLVSEVARTRRADLKVGLSRFETLPSIVDLGGEVDEKIQKDLYELNQVRNVIAHRGGVVDRRLLKACPWLHFQLGDSIKITALDYGRYSAAIGSYVQAVAHRAGIKYSSLPTVRPHARTASILPRRHLRRSRKGRSGP